MSLIEQRISDMNRLYESFFENLDTSKAEAILLELERLNYDKILVSSKISILGSGTFCTAFRISLTKKNNYEFALCVSHQTIGAINTIEGKNFIEWQKRFQRLVDIKENIQLIPPLAILQGEKKFAWLCPCGQSDLKKVSSNWQPLAEVLSQTHSILKSYNIKINDIIQLKSWQGIPFIHDFSELSSYI